MHSESNTIDDLGKSITNDFNITVQNLVVTEDAVVEGNLTVNGALLFNDVQVNNLVVQETATITDLILENPLEPSSGGTGLSTVGNAGQILAVNSGATGLEYKDIPISASSPVETSGGTNPTISLSTVPTTKGGTGLTALGTAGQVLAVNSTATGLEYTSNTTGSVTSVSATTPLSSSGGTTPTISLSSTVPTTKGGTGLSTLGTAGQVLAVNSTATGLEYSNVTAGSVTSVSATAPLSSSGGSTPTISVPLTTGSGTTVVLNSQPDLIGTVNVDGDLISLNGSIGLSARDTSGATSASISMNTFPSKKSRVRSSSDVDFRIDNIGQNLHKKMKLMADSVAITLYEGDEDADGFFVDLPTTIRNNSYIEDTYCSGIIKFPQITALDNENAIRMYTNNNENNPRLEMGIKSGNFYPATSSSYFKMTDISGVFQVTLGSGSATYSLGTGNFAVTTLSLGSINFLCSGIGGITGETAGAGTISFACLGTGAITLTTTTGVMTFTCGGVMTLTAPTTVFTGFVVMNGGLNVNGLIAGQGGISISGGVTLQGATSITGATSVTGAVTISGATGITGAVTITGTTNVSGLLTGQGGMAVQGGVTITGALLNQGAVTITGALAAQGGVTVTGATAITGAVTITGAANITGLLTGQGGANISGAVAIQGGTNITGLLTAQGGASVLAAFFVQGPTNLTGTLTVQGPSNLTGALTVQGAANITGAFALQGAANITGLLTAQGGLNVTGLSNMTGLLTAQGGAVISSFIQILGPTNMTGTLTVQGATNITGAFTLQGAANITGLLTAQGGANITGALAVQGATNVTGLLTAQGGANITGALAVQGATNLSGSLTVQGATNVSGAFGVQGPTVLTGSFTATGGAAITGLTFITGATQISGALNVTGSLSTQGIATFLSSTFCLNGIGVTGGVSIDTVGQQCNITGGSINLFSQVDAVNIHAPEGGCNIGGTAGVTGRFHVETQNGFTGFATGNISLKTVTASPYTGSGNISLDTLEAYSGNIYISAKGVLAFGAANQSSSQTVASTQYISLDTSLVSAPGYSLKFPATIGTLNSILLSGGSSAPLSWLAPGAANTVLTSNGTSLSFVSGSSFTNWASPGTIGSTTPNTGQFTTLTAQSLKVTNEVLQDATISSGPNFKLIFCANRPTASSFQASHLFCNGDASVGYLIINNGFYTASVLGSMGVTSNLVVNTDNAASQTAINPQITVYKNTEVRYGMDLGYNATLGRFRTRIFCPIGGGADISLSNCVLSPTSQSSFTDYLVMNGDTGIVTITNNLSGYTSSCFNVKNTNSGTGILSSLFAPNLTSGNYAGMYFGQSSTVNQGFNFFFGKTATDSTNTFFMNFADNANPRITFTANGTLAISATNFNVVGNTSITGTLTVTNGNIFTNQNIIAGILILNNGNTSLSSSSPQAILIRGGSGSIITLPNATTLIPGYTYTINNNSNNTATINQFTSGTVGTVSPNAMATVTCLTTPNANGSWDIHISGSGTVTSIGVTVPTFLSVSPATITSSGTFAITLSGTALPVINGGTGVTTSTGTGNNVLSTSPTLTTPSISGATTVTGVVTANALTVTSQVIANKTISAGVNFGLLFCANNPNLASYGFFNGDASVQYLSIGDGTNAISIIGNSTTSGNATISGYVYASGTFPYSPTGNGVYLGSSDSFGNIQMNGPNGAYIDFSKSGVDYISRIISWHDTAGPYGTNVLQITAPKTVFDGSSTETFKFISSFATSQSSFNILHPNLSNGQVVTKNFGVSLDVWNSGYEQFNYTADINTNNTYKIGLTGGTSTTYGASSITSTNTGSFTVNNTNTTPGLTNAFLAPNMSLGTEHFTLFGKALSAGNSAFIEYNYYTTPSARFSIFNSTTSITQTYNGAIDLTGSAINLNAITTTQAIKVTTQVLQDATISQGVNYKLIYCANRPTASSFQASHAFTNGDASVGYFFINNGFYTAFVNGTFKVDSELTVGTKIFAQNFEIFGASQSSYIGTGSFLINNGNGALNFGTNTVNGNQWCTFYNSGSSAIGSIFQNGFGGTTFSTTSDYRLKSEIRHEENILETILKLNPVSYLHQYSENGVRAFGFLAHEVQEHLPNLINGTKDEVYEDGKPKYQNIDLAALTPYLVKCIQELEMRIKQLEMKV